MSEYLRRTGRRAGFYSHRLRPGICTLPPTSALRPAADMPAFTDGEGGVNLVAYSAGTGGQAAVSRIRRRWRSFMIRTQVTNDIATTLAPIIDGLMITMP
jgi:hypothetical protein